MTDVFESDAARQAFDEGLKAGYEEGYQDGLEGKPRRICPHNDDPRYCKFCSSC